MFKRYEAFQHVLPNLCRMLKLDTRQLTFGDLSATTRIWLQENET